MYIFRVEFRTRGLHFSPRSIKMLWLPEPGCAMHTPSSLRKLIGHYEVPQSSVREGWALSILLAIHLFAARSR